MVPILVTRKQWFPERYDPLEVAIDWDYEGRNFENLTVSFQYH